MSETPPLPPHLYQACEAVGELMELWGFKRVLGMIWTFVFLKGEPVTARDIKEGLGVSSGLVSMSLAELQHWGVLKRHSHPGDRREYYVAESNIGRPILKVLRERELYQLGTMLDVLKDVRTRLDPAQDAVAITQLDTLITLSELGQVLFTEFLTLGEKMLKEPIATDVQSGLLKTLRALNRVLVRKS